MRRPKGGLNDPRRAAIAWAHYRRMMRWMTLAALLAVAGALAYLGWDHGTLTVAMVVATVGGVGGAVLLAAALMLLAFMSSGTGHDDEADGRP
jgi:hypothetical protein